MNIEISKEVPHAEYCGFLYAEENISSSSDEQFEESNEQSEPMQTNGIELFDSNSISEENADKGHIDWSDSEISLALSITAFRNNVNNETINYTEIPPESHPCLRCEKGSNFMKCGGYNDDRERELLRKKLTAKSEMETQTEYPQKNKHQKSVFMRVIMVVFMILLCSVMIKDYVGSTVISVINYCSKCCLCVCLCSAVNYITSLVKH